MEKTYRHAVLHSRECSSHVQRGYIPVTPTTTVGKQIDPVKNNILYHCMAFLPLVAILGCLVAQTTAKVNWKLHGHYLYLYSCIRPNISVLTVQAVSYPDYTAWTVLKELTLFNTTVTRSRSGFHDNNNYNDESSHLLLKLSLECVKIYFHINTHTWVKRNWSHIRFIFEKRYESLLW